MTGSLYYVIVYDSPVIGTCQQYPVPLARLAQLMQGDNPLTLMQAMQAVAAADLPGCTNFVYTTFDLLPTLRMAQKAKVAELTAKCGAVIIGGYTSTALGTVHAYPSTVIDQNNMIASVTDSLLSGHPVGWTTQFWVMDQNGDWSFAPHTAQQIQQAGSDGKAFITSQQLHLGTLNAQVAACTTVDQVLAITW